MILPALAGIARNALSMPFNVFIMSSVYTHCFIFMSVKSALSLVFLLILCTDVK